MAIDKYPGEKWGATVRFTYKGPGRTGAWVGVGLRTDPYDYWSIPSYWWAATLTDIPACSTDTTLETKVGDVFPDDVPFGKLVDTFKVIAKKDPMSALGNKEAFSSLILARDSDAEVYTVAPASIEWIKIVSAEPYEVK